MSAGAAGTQSSFALDSLAEGGLSCRRSVMRCYSTNLDWRARMTHSAEPRRVVLVTHRFAGGVPPSGADICPAAGAGRGAADFGGSERNRHVSIRA